MSEKCIKQSTVVVTGPDRYFKPAWWATRLQLWRVGVKAVYLSPNSDLFPVGIHGVIIGGGSDIEPVHYGETVIAGTVYDSQRDKLELSIIKHALKTGLPMLGICRGAQLINVSKGGSLYADLRPLRTKTPNRSSIFTFKTANVVGESKLSGIVLEKHIRINSLHNQAVKTLGHSLVAVAHDNDDFVQAIEDPTRNFLLGVQWHPEYLLFSKVQKKLFSAFAKATQERKAQSNRV